jgi:formate dehydrogenase major subunit
VARPPVASDAGIAMRITVNGSDVDVPDAMTLLHGLRAAGIDVPSLCDDDRLEPYGECRMCIVRIDGRPQPVASCATFPHDDMVVETAPDDIESARRGILAMAARHYPPEATAAAPEEPFHKLLSRYQVPATGTAQSAARDDSHPCIAIDMNRCIDCFRCVRICDEVQGQLAWQLAGRGPDTHVVPSGAAHLVESACVSCGACVDTCPTGALEDRPVIELGTPTRWTRTTCPYCGVGCELMIGTRDEHVVTALPAADAPVNRGHACVKGRYAHAFVHADDRVVEPMIRDDDGWHTVSWETAIAAVADGFRRALDEAGPSSVGVFGSARATNEDNYLLQKFARAVLGTNNVDCCARVCHAPSATGLRRAFGTGAATNSFADIERSNTILVCGANATENHPVVGARIKQAARRGAGLIVIDPRRIELAEHADVHLRPEPGSNVLLLNALAATIIEEQLVDQDFVRDRVSDLDEFASFVADYAPERVAERCGVAADDIRAAARLYATQTPSMIFHGLGVTEHTQGTDGVVCLANLALLTGNVGRPGSGVNPLRGQNNVQGSAHMGCEPNYLTGFAPVHEAPWFADVWGADVPDADGLDAMQMLDASAAGTMRALWVVGWDILQTQPNMDVTDRALANLDMLVVQDLFLNETARAHATVFLPACSTFEKDGTFMNGERRVQRVRQAIEPIGDSRADWRIVCAVAEAMGHVDQFRFADPSRIWDEIRAVWPPGAGMSYERLDAPGGLQWPCPSEDHPGTTVLHTTAFPAIGPRATLHRIAHEPSPETPDAHYPLLLITGRTLDQFNAGTMTRRSLTNILRPTDTLDVNEEDAAALGLVDGDQADLTSRYGTATLPVRISGQVRRGECFATFSDPAIELNRVTGPHRDRTTNTPEYKRTMVRVAPHASVGRSA